MYVVRNLLDHHQALGHRLERSQTDAGRDSLLSDLTYIWQFYLPRLPGMVELLPGPVHARDSSGSTGRSASTAGSTRPSPTWVDNLALIPAALIALLGLRALFARRGALRARLSELLVYLVDERRADGADRRRTPTCTAALEGAGYAQPRYLLPLLPLARRACSRSPRAAPAGAGGRRSGALIVVLFLAQDIFSQLLVVARFYA